jgi:uncharacterized protein YbjQ (UPF0145 family)
MRQQLVQLGGESRAKHRSGWSLRPAKLGANAIVATRFSTLVMMAGAAELLATGTAVIVED